MTKQSACSLQQIFEQYSRYIDYKLEHDDCEMMNFEDWVELHYGIGQQQSRAFLLKEAIRAPRNN